MDKQEHVCLNISPHEGYYIRQKLSHTYLLPHHILIPIKHLLLNAVTVKKDIGIGNKTLTECLMANPRFAIRSGTLYSCRYQIFSFPSPECYVNNTNIEVNENNLPGHVVADIGTNVGVTVTIDPNLLDYQWFEIKGAQLILKYSVDFEVI